MNSKRSPNTLFKSTLPAQIILIVAIAGAILIFERFFEAGPRTVDNGSDNEAVLFIDFGNMQRMFAGGVVNGMTVLDALNASVAAGEIKLTYYVDGGNNTKVTEINDHQAGAGEQFVFYVNSRKLDPSELNKTQVNPGDKIIIRLE